MIASPHLHTVLLGKIWLGDLQLAVDCHTICRRNLTDSRLEDLPPDDEYAEMSLSNFMSKV